MPDNSLTLSSEISPVVQEIRTVLDSARGNVARQVNNELLRTYWKIGEIIVRYEQDDNIRAAYGEQTLKQLSKVLTQELGKGFSRSNIYNMRLFYLTYEKFQTVSGKLSWSHYCELLGISDSKVNDPDDNPPIGIILCTDKDSVGAEYALGGLSNNIFASRYVLYMPDKEQLIAQVESVIRKWSRGDKLLQE